MNKMSDTVISVENISKRYLVGHQSRNRSRHTTLRDVIVRGARNHSRKAIDVLLGRQIVQGDEIEEFWALKDVSFDVQKGEIIGIIGRNGAGKSTLLKILSRITEPTAGRVLGRGRVSSLLEVGTGFHPELTGRENIFLNGAILGMTKSEIRRKFDEIVAFAEVERFLDTPVKYYSSGMYVRLAFAVAAHLEPEILIVDEVLAVGDIDFQRKSAGAMQRIADSERTVIFVSHNLALIERLCERCVLLENGRLAASGNTESVIREYSARYSSRVGLFGNLSGSRSRVHAPHLTYVYTIDEKGSPINVLRMGEKIHLKLGISAPQPIRRPWIGIQIRTQNGFLVAHIANRESGFDLSTIHGDLDVFCHIEHPNLQGGVYFIDVLLSDALNHVYDHVEAACRLEIQVSDVFKTGMPMGPAHGLCFFRTTWDMEENHKGVI
jgi:lipopolysaccharide transport system ATP-binding protein